MFNYVAEFSLDFFTKNFTDVCRNPGNAGKLPEVKIEKFVKSGIKN